MTDGDRKGGNASVVLVRWSDGKQERILTAKGGGFAERAVFHPDGFTSVFGPWLQEPASFYCWFWL
jgi:hypothetical protein